MKRNHARVPACSLKDFRGTRRSFKISHCADLCGSVRSCAECGRYGKYKQLDIFVLAAQDPRRKTSAAYLTYSSYKQIYSYTSHFPMGTSMGTPMVHARYATHHTLRPHFYCNTTPPLGNLRSSNCFKSCALILLMLAMQIFTIFLAANDSLTALFSLSSAANNGGGAPCAP